VLWDVLQELALGSLVSPSVHVSVLSFVCVCFSVFSPGIGVRETAAVWVLHSHDRIIRFPFLKILKKIYLL
jgi:hypothetical protein